MNTGRYSVLMALALILVVWLIAAQPVTVRADGPCYDQFQNVIPCPDQKTPRPRRTTAPTATLTSTATETASPTPSATPTQTSTATPTPSITPTLEWAKPAQFEPGPPQPTGGLGDVPSQLLPPLAFAAGVWLAVLIALLAWWFRGAIVVKHASSRRGLAVAVWLVIGALAVFLLDWFPPFQQHGDSKTVIRAFDQLHRLHPHIIVFVVGGLWILVLAALIAGALQSSDTPIPPQDQGRSRRRPPKAAWGAGVLAWLIVGLTITTYRLPLLGPICGLDAFPDLVPASAEFLSTNYVDFKVSNIGACDAPPSPALLVWDTTEAGVKLKAITPPTGEASSFEVAVPSLKRGESQVVKDYLPRSYDVFHGKLWCAFTVDYLHHVPESNETNNTLVFQP